MLSQRWALASAGIGCNELAICSGFMSLAAADLVGSGAASSRRASRH